MTKKLILASPRGFCAGVSRAIEIVEQCLIKHSDKKIFINHEIIHNTFVVEGLKKRGVTFCNDLDQIPDGSLLIFSAHGVSPQFRDQANAKNITTIDATCPLVTKVHFEAKDFAAKNFEIIYIGKKGHQEAVGVEGVTPMILVSNLKDVEKINPADYKDKQVALLSQTTLSQKSTEGIVKSLQEKIPQIQIINDICYATQNRQNAISEVAQKADATLVIGSPQSSNSNKLQSVAAEFGPAILCDNYTKIPEKYFDYETVGISSGASVPTILVDEVLNEFKKRNPDLEIETIKTADETLHFPLPKI